MKNQQQQTIAAIAHERLDRAWLQPEPPCLLCGLIKDALAAVGMIALLMLALWAWAGAV